jgi:periplasmic protein TonB
MNNPVFMDQSEKVGLGAALGGHAFLLALLVFGLYRAAVPMGSDGGGSAGDGIAVSIVSETATEAPAPSSDVAELVPAVEEEQIEVLPDVAPEIVRVTKIQPKKVTQTTLVKDRTKDTGFGSSDFERRLQEQARREKEKEQGQGGNTNDNGQGGGQGANTQAEMIAARSTISGQIKIGNCMPSGIDVNKVTTKVTVKLASNGALLSITDVSQSGRTASNQPQLDPIKRCIVDSIKKITRFTGLDPKTHSSWQLITVPFRSRG